MSTGNIPRHIAIIPDGNRRWASERNLPATIGHEEGVRSLQKALNVLYELEVPCLSFWGASEANLLNRSPREIKSLEKIFEINFKKLSEDKRIHDKQVKVNVIGRWETALTSEKTKSSIRKVIQTTAQYRRYILNFFIAYDGIYEMVEAIKKILNKANSSPDLQITPQLIKENLFTSELPPVDLLIRTGGEPHLSAGFMMWDMAEAQLYFSEKRWPEFTENDLKAAIDEYQNRQRRYGK